LKLKDWQIKAHAPRLKRQEEQIWAGPQRSRSIIQRLRLDGNSFPLDSSQTSGTMRLLRGGAAEKAGLGGHMLFKKWKKP
jgi:hypothetical protein